MGELNGSYTFHDLLPAPRPVHCIRKAWKSSSEVAEASHKHMQDLEEFRWAYSVARIDLPGAPILQYFDRLCYAKTALVLLEAAYPEIPFQIFVQGDQQYLGDPANHENVH